MLLVARNNVGEPYKTVEALTSQDADLLRRYWCAEQDKRAKILPAVSVVLRRVRSLDAWVACDCLGHSAAPPILYTRLTSGGNLSLVREPSRGQHDSSCVFAWEEGTLGVSEADGEFHASQGHRGPPRFLTHTDGMAATPAEAEPRSGPSRHGPPQDPLQRILFYLLQSAGLNQLRPEPHDAATGLARDRAALLMALKRIDASPGICLDQVLWTETNWLYKGWALGALKRLKESGHWPRRRPLQGYLLVPATTIEDREVRCTNGDRLHVSSPVRMSSAHGDGARAPWLVLADLKIAEDGRRMEVLRAYAHPRMDDSFFCVDSDHERHAARALRKAAALVYARSNGAVRISISKPLEDISAGPETCRPDFLLTCGDNRLVVETLGFDTIEYKERKARTHPIMERLGRLFLDHREHSDHSTADDRLIRYVMGWALSAPKVT